MIQYLSIPSWKFSHNCKKINQEHVYFSPPCIVHFKNTRKRTVQFQNNHFKINQNFL